MGSFVVPKRTECLQKRSLLHKVGLQDNVPFIVKTVPVNKLENDSLKEEILTTIELLNSCKVMLDIVLVFLIISIHNSW